MIVYAKTFFKPDTSNVSLHQMVRLCTRFQSTRFVYARNISQFTRDIVFQVVLHYFV